jgi:N-acetylglucosamine transport system permease protein
MRYLKSETPQRKESFKLQPMLTKIGRGWPYQLFLFPFLIAVVFPMIWLFYSSLKTNRELFTSVWALPSVPQWDNYVRAWSTAGISEYFINSITVTGFALTATLFLGACAAYVLARYSFPGSHIIYIGFAAGMMIPTFVGIIPLFFLMKDLGLLDSHLGLISVYVATNLPFTVFVLYGFFRTLPSELSDAAEIDGCSPIGVFFRVMLPLARGGIVAVAIFDFISIWNEYLYALVLISNPKLRTLPLGVANLYIVNRYHADWTALLAGLVIVLIPSFLVYTFFQSQFSEGITIGATKG